MQGNEETKDKDLTFKTIHKTSSRQLIFQETHPLDPDFIRECLLHRDSFKLNKNKGSLASLDGSNVETRLKDFDDDEFLGITSMPFSKIEDIKAIIHEAEMACIKKDFETALKRYLGASFYFNDMDCENSECLPLYTSCKLGLASLYFMNKKMDEAEKEIIELKMVNKSCEEADELYKRIISEPK